MAAETSNGRLVLVVYPFQGHINPMLQLATVLHSKGFSITIVHPEFNSPDPSRHPEFTFMSVQDRLVQDSVPIGNILATARFLNEACREPFRLRMELMLSSEKERVAGVLYDGFMYFAQSVADLFDLPGINVRTSAAASTVALSLLPRPDRTQGYVSLTDIAELGPDLQVIEVESLVSNSPYPKEEFQEFRANFTSALQRASAIVVNTIDFLEGESLSMIQKYYSGLVLGVGPFHKLSPNVSSSLLVEDRSCISWLDKQTPRSVIYVSFGSMAGMGANELLEVAWGLANSEQPFLWVIRPDMVSGSNFRELLPESFYGKVGERGCIVQWAPQQEVLRHTSVGGFWTHCGWNSTLESVGEGVPLLCRPFFGDQTLNKRYICYLWKIGIELEGEFGRGRVAKAVRRLMAGIEGEETRQRATEFKHKAELCFKEGGSTAESFNTLVNHLLRMK